ncbi:MAG: tRNA (adenosine(37)-N6)-threonylcarbamoyltransferase complex ATPase subunit type 1 TsaE [Patescibacteria group bacterium]|nr:tRNA (adenosine(37)-N6)-threonylcarbamoyltransferase complex ATPase subunit type 1 TsaE [Patescibacteria group bacterium]
MGDAEIYTTNRSEETKLLGEKFAKKLKTGDFLAFYGNLGSGKTTFIQGLAKGLGIKRRIISPTFIIVRHYKLEKGNFYHVDLYRAQTKNDLLSVGLGEVIEDENNIVALEWAEKMKELLPKKRIELHFKYMDENKREIIIKYI